ncbi:hypothetical protein BAUCODRAFT_435474 [Baudoinia panamericana UAMH 10762]|uniref:Uncharacterized protein n=1 Tax=Baudoinia panamericana (strain UAMH 10762) TaxID=717646 RepID=M2NCU9_BAUPA|nr:uncharacterized protein BAUCODRAFT_435474 [Baudoinia panamericana UAMH 10762]EMC97009.1 hypothetical protein BAUCODRAFT_435474 [Baudoinia panamericana UAMH 10762]
MSEAVAQITSGTAIQCESLAYFFSHSAQTHTREPNVCACLLALHTCRSITITAFVDHILRSCRHGQDHLLEFAATPDETVMRSRTLRFDSAFHCKLRMPLIDRAPNLSSMTVLCKSRISTSAEVAGRQPISWDGETAGVTPCQTRAGRAHCARAQLVNCGSWRHRQTCRR